MNERLTGQLVVVGIAGTVLAFERTTGAEVWRNRLKGSSNFVNVVVDASQVFVTTGGEFFCLNKLTGQILWHNRLKGLGHGLVTIATENTSSRAAALGQRTISDQEASSAAAAVSSAT